MPTASAHHRLEQALERIDDDPARAGAPASPSMPTPPARPPTRPIARARQRHLARPARRRDRLDQGPVRRRGEPTRAGSKILADAQPAPRDAPVVQRLRAAGAVIVAKTNMSEFAFSGVGANPHYGTPGNPADRTRVPGGSSSGAAVAVADGMCEIAIGTDTGGSTRIPAALCGIVGFKPSKQRVPTDGAFPLSFTLDSVGPLARTVAECARADAVMAGEDAYALDAAPLRGCGSRCRRSDNSTRWTTRP